MGIKLSGDISEIHGIYQNFAKKLWILVYPEDALNVDQVLEEIFDFERNLSRVSCERKGNIILAEKTRKHDFYITYQTRMKETLYMLEIFYTLLLID